MPFRLFIIFLSTIFCHARLYASVILFTPRRLLFDVASYISFFSHFLFHLLLPSFSAIMSPDISFFFFFDACFFSSRAAFCCCFLFFFRYADDAFPPSFSLMLPVFLSMPMFPSPHVIVDTLSPDSLFFAFSFCWFTSRYTYERVYMICCC